MPTSRATAATAAKGVDFAVRAAELAERRYAHEAAADLAGTVQHDRRRVHDHTGELRELVEVQPDEQPARVRGDHDPHRVGDVEASGRFEADVADEPVGEHHEPVDEPLADLLAG